MMQFDIENLEASVFESIDSTNLEAKRLIKKHKGDNQQRLLVAKEQTGGRGRFERQWHSPIGGAYFTLMLHSEIQEEKYPLISLIVANSVRKSLAEDFHIDNVMIKWPNDIVSHDGKYGGILIEVLSGILIIGVGLNVYNTNAPRGSYLYNSQIDFNQIASHILSASKIIMSDLDDFVDKKFSLDTFKDEYVGHLFLMNEQVTVLDSVEGTPIASGKLRGVDLEGRLLLEEEDGAIRHFQTQVTLRRRF